MNKYILALFLLIPVIVAGQDGACKAVKADSTACKAKGNFVNKKTGYCHTHAPNTPRCGVKKKDGKPCRIVTKKIKINGVEQTTACRFHSTEQ